MHTLEQIGEFGGMTMIAHPFASCWLMLASLVALALWAWRSSKIRMY